MWASACYAGGGLLQNNHKKKPKHKYIKTRSELFFASCG